ncbi:uncharacterized protein K460DRAFT_359023 [Cucurbitaria berberidis CBS 394.84]|uniref:Uncharacterized protein n=1 Tax=Cucurbitaria berberidis CBS 394.84 TaxID=1168544 RepID=A0A9P4GBY7_9PLEO|nr:uncharacterized protein K460DRAFT_359023 [Cucurbitaria berberidis CBS 394.84]KAF1842410.1 hypothetical protein K460DRAFT_359023 [Cucurbitaria berberidis CBS 394.84]
MRTTRRGPWLAACFRLVLPSLKPRGDVHMNDGCFAGKHISPKCQGRRKEEPRGEEGAERISGRCKASWCMMARRLCKWADWGTRAMCLTSHLNGMFPASLGVQWCVQKLMPECTPEVISKLGNDSKHAKMKGEGQRLLSVCATGTPCWNRALVSHKASRGALKSTHDATSPDASGGPVPMGWPRFSMLLDNGHLDGVQQQCQRTLMSGSGETCATLDEVSTANRTTGFQRSGTDLLRGLVTKFWCAVSVNIACFVPAAATGSADGGV